MIIINKKRISIIFIMLAISVLSYGIVYNKDKRDTITTSSLPVTNKVIVLAAGHGKPDERCTK